MAVRADAAPVAAVKPVVVIVTKPPSKVFDMSELQK
jgi:hypothetical protein